MTTGTQGIEKLSSHLAFLKSVVAPSLKIKSLCPSLFQWPFGPYSFSKLTSSVTGNTCCLPLCSLLGWKDFLQAFLGLCNCSTWTYSMTMAILGVTGHTDGQLLLSRPLDCHSLLIPLTCPPNPPSPHHTHSKSPRGCALIIILVFLGPHP